ncbi:MAG: hypothetical protein Rubg2KO_09930 [Rubricoccaceae bacterium]
MPSRYRQIGRVLEVDAGSGRAGDLLTNELALYPSPARDAPVELTVRLGSTPESGLRSRNPSLHIERDAGFTARGVMASATYSFEDDRVTEVLLDVHAAPHAFGRMLRRLANSQFTDRVERIGVLYHETVLVPTAAFDPERAPIHASGLQAPDGGVTLFGGTGGVGKTSLELHLGRHSGYRFLADDVAVLDKHGRVYPNLAYPKIYGYNAPPGSDLRTSVVRSRSPLDRAHWAVHAMRGPDRVRRRMPPDTLFSGTSSDGGPLHRYVMLTREARNELVIEPLSHTDAAQMSTAILAAELSGLMRHVHWHVLNRTLQGRLPIQRPEDLLARWTDIYSAAFANAECLIARIPIDIPHDAFLDQMHRALDS